MDWFEKILIAVMAACVLVLGVVVFLMFKEVKDCTSAGGHWEGTGKYSTTYVMSGKIMIPVTDEEKVCVKGGK